MTIQKHCGARTLLSVLTLLCAAWPACTPKAQAQTNQTIYTNALLNGWENWGWATLNYQNSSPTHSGTASISVSAAAWEALYLHHAAFDTTPYASLSFWIHGGSTGGQRLQVQALRNGAPQAAVALTPLTAGVWQQVTISLLSLGVANTYNMDGFWIQDTSGTTQPTFYVDDITLIAKPSTPPPANGVTVRVDVTAWRRAISRWIYGVNFASPSSASDLNIIVNRSGGNSQTRYNWRLNADNRGSDWYFMSIADASATPGERATTFVRNNKSIGVQSMITIPMIGWVANVNADRSPRWSFSVAKYGAQQATEPWHPDAGNGVRTTGAFVTGNDPRDAHVPANPAYMQGWVQQLVNTFGRASSGGVSYYLLDNEFGLWHETHRDVFPIGLKMDDAFTRMRSYALMIKAVDPSASVVGPEEWGWSGYFMSGYDKQWGAQNNNWTNLPDRAAHGGMAFMPWLLQQFRADQNARGQRLLDVFSLHYYPQSGEFSEDVSPAMQLRRNRSTRSLWDLNYVDESWINAKVCLVPRMKGWVAQNYPGTKIGLTEYNWGAEGHINGATAQAEILGILGREGMDIATRWVAPAPNTPVYNAFKMYRNYDGARGKFGDIAISCTVPDPDTLSAFASQDGATGPVKVMVISKALSGQTNVTLSLSHFTPAGTARVYQLTAANRITRLPDRALTGTTLTQTVPAQSITLFVIPKQA
ncbi:MAG: cellulase [Armatimonadota bacterium]|nr:cellulase [Armatimonadota bacterium]